MKRLSENEKRQLGIIIHYYRNSFFRSNSNDSQYYKQINFCKDICSQAQLSRLENGDALKDQEVYEALLDKLNLDIERVANKDIITFETYFENILSFQNDDNLVINYNEYVLIVNKYQNIFKKNIILTHYNYALEFILAILNEDTEEASYIIEDVENTIDILPPKFMVLTLQYIGKYYYLINNYNKANKYYLLAIEHMHKFNINNSIIYIEIAFNEYENNKSLYALNYLYQGLDNFMNTNNYEIITRIYHCFGLIYLKDYQYEDGVNFIYTSLDYCLKSNNHELLNETYCLLAISLYFSKNYQSSFKIINQSLVLQETEKATLLKFIIGLKLKLNGKIILKDKIYKLIYDLYTINDDREIYFERNIENLLNELKGIIKLLIISDMYEEYKESKKYKKALELVEKYRL